MLFVGLAACVSQLPGGSLDPGIGGAAGATSAGAAGTGGGTAGAAGSIAGTGGGSAAAGRGESGGDGGAAESAPANLPPTLNVPAGAAVKFRLHATGDQIYTCLASAAGGAGGAGSGTTFSYVLKQPDARLYDATNTQVGTHGAGPSWTSTVDSSVVTGAKAWQEDAPVYDAIPWLLLRATSNAGTGVFSDVTYVQRVNTTGGKAPAAGCDATTPGKDTRVAYTADYYFYSGGASVTAWATPPGNLPPAIQVPMGVTLKIHAHAIGVQVYTCTGATSGAGSDTTYSYVLQQPDAVLYDSSFAQVGTHGLGPNWTSTVDGSVVDGAKVSGVNSTMAGAIQWLLLQATTHSGTGAFSDVTYVQRLNTAGGAAPATGCDATTPGASTRIPFSADYYFFTGS